MDPNYRFISSSGPLFLSNGMHISNSLDQLRTSADFRAIEAKVADKYDNVVVVIGDNVIPLTERVSGVRFPEVTDSSGRTRYIYIETSTTSIKFEDGVFKSLAVEQIFVHAMAHAASDLGPDLSLGTNRNSPNEIEAISRTNTVSREAQLDGPRDTGHPMFLRNEPSPIFPGFKFSNGEDVKRGEVTLPDGVPTVGELARGGPVKKIEQGYNDEDETTLITFFGTDNSKTSVEIDPDNREPWSSKKTFEDADGDVRTVQTISHSLGGQLAEFDPKNTHPYSELDIDTDASKKVTGVQLKLDKDTETRSTNGSLVDLSVIGQVFGSSIGRILAPDTPFGHLLGGTVGGLIGQKLAQNFAASLSFDASKGTNADFTTFSGLDVASAAAGSVASFLIAEIGTKLGLEGYGAQLFNSGASAFTGSILNTVIQKGGLQVLAQEATWASAFATAEGAVGGAVGGILAQNLVHAESKEGAVGGQLLGAVGSALGMSFVALQAITGILGFVIPGFGSFFGTILGTMLGDAIAGDPGAPKAFHDVQILGSDTHFTNRLVGTDDHGNAEISRKMSAEVVTIANNFLDAIHGAGISYPGKVMIGYSDGPGPYDYITGWFPNGTEVAPRFTDPNDAIQEGVRELLMQTEVIGGDLLLKRAQHAFVTGSHPDPYSEPTNFKDLIGLSGDLRTAQDYQIYLNNREAINAVMAVNPDTAFTAGWIATFARVNDLKLNQMGASDFLGGLVGYLDSVNKAGLGAEAANAKVMLSGTDLKVGVKIANGAEVPGSLSVFADQTTQSSDATGTTVSFSFAGALAVGGYLGPASVTLADGWWQVTGGTGNNLWFGGDDHRNNYHDDPAGGATTSWSAAPPATSSTPATAGILSTAAPATTSCMARRATTS
jgi:hypothetical protein